MSQPTWTVTGITADDGDPVVTAITQGTTTLGATADGWTEQVVAADKHAAIEAALRAQLFA